jgi:acyl dehydratase
MTQTKGDAPAADVALIRREITDTDVALMRERIGYPNPALRKGVLTKPWNIRANADAIRRWAECIGDANPLYQDEEYAARTRWQGSVAPPGFEWSMGIDRGPAVPEELNRRTRSALRGIQLYHSGAEYRYYAPIMEGTKLYKSECVARVEEKTSSRFGTRSVLVDNATSWWDEADIVAVTSSRWFVHAERRALSSGTQGANADKDVLTNYTDEQLEEIERAYDTEYVRGADTLYIEDAQPGQASPVMVKGPLTITDMINMHMAGGWLTYGNPPFRLAFENRKKLRGFYSRNEFNCWDTIQRVHWDAGLAHSIGVPHMYDIGPMRFVMLCHYLSNFAGDDAWVHRIRYELRNFNYVGDTTWIRGSIKAVRVDEVLGPLIELEIKGTNQRDQVNMSAEATVLVASRKTGLAKLPPSPPLTINRRP